MSRVSKVSTLPPELQKELFKRAAANSLGGYDELEVWLKEQGHPISSTALQVTLSAYKGTLLLLQQTKFLHYASGGKVDLRSALQAVSIMQLTNAIRDHIKRGRR